MLKAMKPRQSVPVPKADLDAERKELEKAKEEIRRLKELLTKIPPPKPSPAFSPTETELASLGFATSQQFPPETAKYHKVVVHECGVACFV